MSFICSSFKNQEEHDFEFIWPSPSPSRKARSHMFCCGWNKEYNNPYSNRGLEKFEALLADLDDKKRKIFTQKGSEYISLVRFVYSNSHVKPIIVRLKDPRRHHDKDHHKQNNFKDRKSTSLPKLQGTSMLEPPGDVPNGTMIETKEAQHAKRLIDKVTKKVSFDQWKPSLKRKLEEWWMPSYNLPLFVILVLVFLMFFGQSLAIICTSIAWYLIPTIDGTLENTTARSPKKMITIQHSRKPSESKVLSSPKPFFSGPMNVKQTNKMKKLMSF
ncbi:hypothetical protein L1987_53497 [Smallanthus sonchifolius]|uniref:Uncharacterized protein n=1 Tax=Smallanthus sonchifolius TaxID=185202 RepID=A0ACB9EWP3_9ASTR|nr:hypothetical protein L1987_53497 [Smallanthus sonchifolius]